MVEETVVYENTLEWVETSTGFLAYTPFGGYAVEQIDDDRRFQWRYCFDEYYDEAQFECEDFDDGKRMAQIDWNSRLNPILSNLTSNKCADNATIEAIRKELSECKAENESYVDLVCENENLRVEMAELRKTLTTIRNETIDECAKICADAESKCYEARNAHPVESHMRIANEGAATLAGELCHAIRKLKETT